MTSIGKRRGLKAAAATLAVSALLLTSCASQRNETGPSNTGSATGTAGSTDGAGSVNSTFVFASSSDPTSLDPATASDGESFRVARQIFEGLVGTKPGTADPAPLLAESWTPSADGKSYDFKLKTGVKFQDNTDFNAEAVCANFDRWYNFKGILQTEGGAYYYKSLFQGYATKDTAKAVFKSCEAKGDSEVTINLTRPWVGFVAALSLPAFSMQSPAAMKQYDADGVGGTADAPVMSEYGKGHPVGTGPFKFVSWTNGQQIVLDRNPDYWGDKGQIEKVIFQVISDPTARKQALESKNIDGYDLVGPADLQSLKDGGFNLINRDAFNILYLGINSKQKELSDPKVRQAISYAIDKDQLIKQVMPAGTKKAVTFVPSTVRGYTEDVEQYNYDPEKAKALLTEAGYPNGFETTFYYPTDVSRPYMPTPADTFTNISQQLAKVGIKVTPKPMKWTQYIPKVQNSDDHGLHLLGWTGDYNDPDNFVGVFFNGEKQEFGFKDDSLFKNLDDARQMSNEEEQTKKYSEILKQISQVQPAVPIAHPVPTLAFNPRVTSYPASPVQDEVYNMVKLSK